MDLDVGTLPRSPCRSPNTAHVSANCGGIAVAGTRFGKYRNYGVVVVRVTVRRSFKI